MVKFLIGGSPCTHWSIAQSKNRETAAAGIGWELFRNYLIAKDKFMPDFFLYENNKSAAQAIKDQISLELGRPLQYINSALVSAQSRQRFYVHNFGDVPQPEDRGIVLRDILQSTTGGQTIPLNCGKGGKAQCLRETCYKDGMRNLICNTVDRRTCVAECVPVDYKPHKDSDIVITGNSMRCQRRDKKHSTIQGTHVTLPGGKTQTVSVAHVPMTFEEAGALQGMTPIYKVEGGKITVKGQEYEIDLPDGFYIIRKLTVTECCRLQTLPDDYCRVANKTHAYMGLGNGWTAEVIIHLLSYVLKGIPKDEEIIVLSMYDGIGTGRYCFDKLGYKNIRYFAYEIDKYAMEIAQSNFPDIVQCGDAFQVREDGWRLEYEESPVVYGSAARSRHARKGGGGA